MIELRRSFERSRGLVAADTAAAAAAAVGVEVESERESVGLQVGFDRIDLELKQLHLVR